MRAALIDFLAGMVTACYLAAALFFLRFWRRTHDRLFRTFAVAFALMGGNQLLASWLGADDERTGLTYVLRVLGFLLILYAIVQKNVDRRQA